MKYQEQDDELHRILDEWNAGAIPSTEMYSSLKELLRSDLYQQMLNDSQQYRKIRNEVLERVGVYSCRNNVEHDMSNLGDRCLYCRLEQLEAQLKFLRGLQKELLAAGQLIETLWRELEEIAFSEYSDSAEKWIEDKEQLKLLHEILNRRRLGDDDWKSAIDALDNERLRQIEDYKRRFYLALELLRKANGDSYLLYSILDESDYERLEEVLKMGDL